MAKKTESSQKYKGRGIAKNTSQEVTDIMLQSQFGKLPPQAIDLEEAVLGALMLEKNALTSVIDILPPDCFYKDAHRIIYGAIRRLFEKSQPIDLLTVSAELRQSGELELIGGPYYLTQLTRPVASAANIEYHARIVLQKHIQRELIRISGETLRDAYNETSDVFDLLDRAEQNLFDVAQGNIQGKYREMSDLVSESIKQIEHARRQESGVTGVASGFSELDKVTSGWQKSDLVIIAARPGMGKTAFVLSLARNAAVLAKKPVAIFSLEMSAVQLAHRLISAETELSADKLRKGALKDHEWEQLNSLVKNISEAPLYIDDTPALSIFDLRSKCRRLKVQHNVELIIVDYIQLMRSEIDSRSGNREQEISLISRSLKSIAKELNVPVIAISQLNRSVEARLTKKPMLSDLRESGAIEQDADMVLFIYRPEYYNLTQDEEGNPTAGVAEIIIAKHRNGALKDVKVRFIDRLAKFVELETFDYATADTGSSVLDFPGSITKASRMDDIDDNPPF
ncbi:MAG: replicative DNA helicase [Bacteroidia bacterium]|nr:replicative DNA helicase [Bacteroidia bacterium]